MNNIKRLVVQKCNVMASTMKVLNMHQDSDQPVLNLIAQLRAAARQCNFKVKCACRKNNDFTDLIVLYKFVAGVSDMELQEDFLTEAELTLESAEKLAVAKESAQFSQAALSGEKISRLKSTYKKSRGDAAERTSSSFGGSKKHADRKECPA